MNHSYSSTLKSTSQIFFKHHTLSKQLDSPSNCIHALIKQQSCCFIYASANTCMNSSLTASKAYECSIHAAQTNSSLIKHSGRKELGEKYGKTAGPLELNENSRRGGKGEKKCGCVHYRTAGLSTRATMK